MHKWVMPCNWKFPAENFGGDSYHVQWSHLSAVKTNFSLDPATKPETSGSLVSPGNGHVLICFGPIDVVAMGGIFTPGRQLEVPPRQLAAELYPSVDDVRDAMLFCQRCQLFEHRVRGLVDVPSQG